MPVSQQRPGSGWHRRPALALILGLGGLLAGCGGSGIQVQREAHLPAGSAGASFVMLDGRGQETDPRHARNAEMVAAELTARRFVRVTDPATARFAVMVWERSRELRSPDSLSGGPSGSDARGRGGSYGGGMSSGMSSGMGSGGMGGSYGGGLNGNGISGGSMGGGGMGGPGGSRMRGEAPPMDSSPTSRSERRVEIQIYDLTQPRGPGQHVFNATARLADAQAGGAGATEMITAALRDFPGRPSESFSVPVTR